MPATSLRPKLLTPFARAARTYAGAPAADGIYTSPEIVNNLGYTRLIVRVMADTEVATSTLAVKVQGYDGINALWYDMPGCSLASISANATTPVDLIVGPGITVVANRAISTVLPRRMRIHCTIATSGADGFTFGVEAELHP